MTSREQFEAWAEESGALPWGYLKKQRTQNGGYSVQIYNYMWSAWQASREAVRVEMPDIADASDKEEMLEMCRQSVYYAGIKVKGE